MNDKRRWRDAELYDAVADITREDWDAIVKSAVDQASKGDFRARQWLSDLLLNSDENGFTNSFKDAMNKMRANTPDTE